MKKLILYILLITGTTSIAFAQKDAQAKAILSQVSHKYKSFTTIKSDFSFTLYNRQAGEKITQSGTLITQPKTNKFRLTLFGAGNNRQDAEQEIISDGKSQWTYLKKDKEVQVSDADHSGQGFNPAQLFTIYEHGYKYLYTGDQKLAGKTYQVIDLTPDDAKGAFFKIRLTIDKIKKQIYSALIFNKNGDTYNYTLRTFNTNIKIADNAFTFDTKTHPGVEVVDLR